MTRHKSRVARRNRRSARRGTRKQSGGFLFGLFGSKPATDAQPAAQPATPVAAQPAASPVAAQPAASPAAVNPTADDKPWWKKINIFGSSNDGNKSTPASGQDGGRKTRHRRRSPRHRRK